MWTKMPFRLVDEDWDWRPLPGSGLVRMPCERWITQSLMICVVYGIMLVILGVSSFFFPGDGGYMSSLQFLQYAVYGVVLLLLGVLMFLLLCGKKEVWARGRKWACVALAGSAVFGVWTDAVMSFFGPLYMLALVLVGFWGAVRGVERRLTSDPVPDPPSVVVPPSGRVGDMRFDDERGDGLLISRDVWDDHTPRRLLTRIEAWVLLFMSLLCAGLGGFCAYMSAGLDPDRELFAGGVLGVVLGVLMVGVDVCSFRLVRRPMARVCRRMYALERLVPVVVLLGLMWMGMMALLDYGWDWAGLIFVVPCVPVFLICHYVRAHLVANDDDQ